jgi:hypothetical protein
MSPLVIELGHCIKIAIKLIGHDRDKRSRGYGVPILGGALRLFSQYRTDNITHWLLDQH